MDFALPELGEGVYEAELIRWLVAVGETVQHGQSLMEVMTDKATMEVPSPFEGKVTALTAEPGQQLKVGAVVLTFEGSMVGSRQPSVSTASPTQTRAAEAPARNGPAVATA